VNQFGGLFADGARDGRMGVAQSGDGDAAQGVQVLVTISIVKPGTLAVIEGN
jgi:hypothetical protein